MPRARRAPEHTGDAERLEHLVVASPAQPLGDSGAALRQKGIELTDYVLDPINLQHIEDWLERNQQMHVDMDGLVGSQSIDLTDVDFQDKKQLQAWITLHYLDHQTVEQRLGIGS